jgi:hypothetical protein
MMSEESVSATVYSYWHYFFIKSLMQEFTSKHPIEGRRMSEELQKDGKMEMRKFWTDQRRVMLTDNYDFQDFYQNLIINLAKDPVSTELKYGKICKSGFSDNY